MRKGVLSRHFVFIRILLSNHPISEKYMHISGTLTTTRNTSSTESQDSPEAIAPVAQTWTLAKQALLRGKAPEHKAHYLHGEAARVSPWHSQSKGAQVANLCQRLGIDNTILEAKYEYSFLGPSRSQLQREEGDSHCWSCFCRHLPSTRPAQLFFLQGMQLR